MKEEIPDKCTLCGGDFEIDGKRAIYPYPEKEYLCLTCFIKETNLQPHERIAHGILAGVKLTVKPLIGNDKSQAEAREYFKKGQEEINKGLELIPDRLRIRLATPEDVKRFTNHGHFPFVSNVPRIGEVLIEAEYSDTSEYLSDFNVITKTQLSICLLKKEHVFLKSVYSFSKVDNRPRHFIIQHPIPMPEIFASQGIHIHPDDKEEITNIINKINCLDSNTINSIRLAGDRLLRSSHNLSSEDTLIDLCIAFEALFLQGKRYRAPMGQVIGLACSMLLGKENTERIEIRKTIESGFDIRNKVVHGHDIDENLRKSINEILQDFKNYLSRSILKLL